MLQPQLHVQMDNIQIMEFVFLVLLDQLHVVHQMFSNHVHQMDGILHKFQLHHYQLVVVNVIKLLLLHVVVLF